MNYAVKRLDLAEADALVAARWYDQQQSGLGDEFLSEIERAIAALGRNPLLYSVRFGDVRCAPVQRFKAYGVFYVIRGAEVWVFSVFHGARHPRWLRERRRGIG